MVMIRTRYCTARWCRSSIGVFLGLSTLAMAGEIDVGRGWRVVSRSCAPAGTQESITYKPFDHRWLWTASLHYDAKGNFLHTVNTIAAAPKTNGWQDTWRSWAGHFASEFWYGKVIGSHWAFDKGVPHALWYTEARDCNIGAERPLLKNEELMP